jgi:hypothetical protein
MSHAGTIGRASDGVLNASHPPRLNELVDEILDDMIDSGDYLLADKNRDALRARLAVAVLQCAETGEDDTEALRRRVLELFRAPAAARTAA